MENIIIMAETKPTLTKVFEITDPDILDTWFVECTERGFENNLSAEAMRFDWVLEQGGKWWGSMERGRVVAVSGMHPHFLDGWRMVFRGAQLEAREDVKWSPFFTHIHTWYDQASYQLEYAQSVDGKNVLVYSSTVALEENAHSPRSHNFHKNMSLAAEVGLVEYVGTKKVYGELQAIWKHNMEVIMEKQVVRPGLYSLMDVINDKNVREHVSS